MLKNYDTRTCPDLRPKKSIKNEINYSRINTHVCMVIFVTFAILLYCIISVVFQNPIY